MKMERSATLLARGPLQVEPIWQTDASGDRRPDGYRLRDMTQVEVMNAQAKLRHAARHAALPPEDRPAFVAPFTVWQVNMARAYRDLVEWREGSMMRGADLGGSGGGAGGGAGLFIDSYIERGRLLEVLQARIGEVVVMDIRRHMDRGNARRPITARAVVDAVVLAGCDLTTVLERYGWAGKGKSRSELRAGLCSALDRMAGSGQAAMQAWLHEDVKLQANAPHEAY